MLGVVISLVDQHHFSAVIGIPRCFVSWEVFLDCHNRVLFESLEDCLVDFQVVANHRVLIAVNVVDLRMVNTFVIFAEHHHCLVDASS